MASQEVQNSDAKYKVLARDFHPVNAPTTTVHDVQRGVLFGIEYGRQEARAEDAITIELLTARIAELQAELASCGVLNEAVSLHLSSDSNV